MAQIATKQAAGFLCAGAIVGVAIALLYAPQSGFRTKKNIKKFARKTLDRIDDLQGDIRNHVSDWVDEMTEIVQDGVGRGKKIGEEGYEQLLQAFDSAKECVEDGRSRIERLLKVQ